MDRASFGGSLGYSLLIIKHSFSTRCSAATSKVLPQWSSGVLPNPTSASCPTRHKSTANRVMGDGSPSGRMRIGWGTPHDGSGGISSSAIVQKERGAVWFEFLGKLPINSARGTPSAVLLPIVNHPSRRTGRKRTCRLPKSPKSSSGSWCLKRRSRRQGFRQWEVVRADQGPDL